MVAKHQVIVSNVCLNPYQQGLRDINYHFDNQNYTTETIFLQIQITLELKVILLFSQFCSALLAVCAIGIKVRTDVD